MWWGDYITLFNNYNTIPLQSYAEPYAVNMKAVVVEILQCKSDVAVPC